jgi:hypothetical protein
VQALPQIASYVVSDYRVSPASEAIWALSTLRCRLCRYLFYAELPPSRKTSYLIRDEVSKLDRVSRALNNIPGFAKNSAALNKVIGCFALADADQNGLNSAILRIENESALVNDIFNSLAEFVS